MLDFYFYSAGWLIALFVVGMFLFCVQAAYVGSILFNRARTRKWVLIGEAMILVYIGMLTVLPIAAIVNRRYGIVDFTSHTYALYVAGILLILYFTVKLVRKRPNYYLPIIAVAITLPYMSVLEYNGYIAFYIIALCVLITRSLLLFLSEIHRQRYSLSAYSIKEGLDTLGAGVMFCGNDGYIHLTNRKMSELIVRFFGEMQTDGNAFWQKIEGAQIDAVMRHIVEDDIILRSNFDAWRFSRRAFEVKDSEYTEIIAIEVTKTIQAFAMLERDKETLLLQRVQIQKLTQNMEALRQEQEFSRIRSQVHDVMSQRLTAMQRLLQSHDAADYDALLPLLRDMVEQIKAKEGGSVEKTYNELCVYFKRVGLSIEITGELPEDEPTAFMFLSVLREACTNALRHAGATKIQAHIKRTDSHYNIEITNNGRSPKKGIVAGGGISGMRNRVENIGGQFRVELIP